MRAPHCAVCRLPMHPALPYATHPACYAADLGGRLR